MSRRLSRLALFSLLAASALGPAPARAIDLGWTALGGWQGGGVLRLTSTATGVVKKLPLSFDVGIGHAFIDPGDAALARRVFINENTNGTPEESGGVWDFRVDGVWGLKVSGLQDAGVFGGVRYSMYSGRFKYVGGNEDFIITSNAWGLGVGARGSLAVNRRWSLTASLGLDWFPTQTVYGHDASYSSNNVNNGRENFTWSDADRAVNQPWLLPSLLVGVSWRQ
ncbi:MAG: hypothetical protein IPO09_00750 [Anaeromyxobacter sp.]|nr:hypothetical protein [Anaeromyxobacter sp.]MBL0278303.1 hypothetical protein [Anaeromyxobacter sp.]